MVYIYLNKYHERKKGPVVGFFDRLFQPNGVQAENKRIRVNYSVKCHVAVAHGAIPLSVLKLWMDNIKRVYKLSSRPEGLGRARDGKFVEGTTIRGHIMRMLHESSSDYSTSWIFKSIFRPVYSAHNSGFIDFQRTYSVENRCAQI